MISKTLISVELWFKKTFLSRELSKKKYAHAKGSVPGGKDMVQVDVFNEGLDSESSLNFLIAHDLGNLEGSSSDTSNEGMSELSFLEY